MSAPPVYRVHPSFVINRTKELAIEHARVLGHDDEHETEVSATPPCDARSTASSSSSPPSLVLTSRSRHTKGRKSDKNVNNCGASDLYKSLIPDETIPRVVLQPNQDKKRKLLAFPIAVNRIVRRREQTENDLQTDVHASSSAAAAAAAIGDESVEMRDMANMERWRRRRRRAAYMVMRSYHDAAMNLDTFPASDAESRGNGGNGAADNGNDLQQMRPSVLFRDPVPHEISLWSQMAFTLLSMVDTAVLAYLLFANYYVEKTFGITPVSFPEGNTRIEPPFLVDILVRFIAMPILFLFVTLINFVGVVGVWRKSSRLLTLFMVCLTTEFLLDILYIQSYFEFVRLATLIALYIFAFTLRSKLMFLWYKIPML